MHKAIKRRYTLYTLFVTTTHYNNNESMPMLLTHCFDYLVCDQIWELKVLINAA
jgi:hypothetical protein